MAFKVTRPKRQELSVERQKEISLQIQQAKVFPSTPKVWEGFEDHVNIYSMVKYIGDSVLAYIPEAYINLITLNEDGTESVERVKQDYDPVIQFDLRNYDGKYVRRVRSTNFDTALPEYGLSGVSPINYYRELSSRYYNASLTMDLIRTYGTDDISSLDEDSVLALRRKWSALSPVSYPRTFYFVPIAQFFKNEDGKGWLTDDKGKLVFKLSWVRLSENQLKKFSTAYLTNQSVDGDFDKDYVASNFGGSIVKMTYPDNEIKDANTRVMKAAQDVSLTFMDLDDRKLGQLGDKIREVVDDIEVLASKYYTNKALEEAVIEATLIDDAQLEELLSDLYGDLKTKVEGRERDLETLRSALTNEVPSKPSKPASEGIEGALKAPDAPKVVGQLETVSEEDFDIDFDAE